MSFFSLIKWNLIHGGAGFPSYMYVFFLGGVLMLSNSSCELLSHYSSHDCQNQREFLTLGNKGWSLGLTTGWLWKLKQVTLPGFHVSHPWKGTIALGQPILQGHSGSDQIIYISEGRYNYHVAFLWLRALWAHRSLAKGGWKGRGVYNPRITPGHSPWRMQFQEKAILFPKTYRIPTHCTEAHLIQLFYLP